MKVRKMRLLRHKYGISRREVAILCGVSPQRISRIELDEHYGLAGSTVKNVMLAFETIIVSRRNKLDALQADYAKHKSSLLERVEERDYEL